MMPAFAVPRVSPRLNNIRPSSPAHVSLRGEKNREAQPLWLRDAFAVQVHAQRGNVKRCAAAIDRSESLVKAFSDINNPLAPAIPAWWIVPICNELGSYTTLDAMEEACGRVAIALPQATAPEHATVVQHAGEAMQQFSELLREVGQRIADGEIDAEDRAVITREGMDVHRAIAALIALVQQQESK